MSMQVINPKVNVVSFGPEIRLKNGKIMTPEEFVYGAANITYKDIGALRELMELKENDVDMSKKVEKMLIKVGGSGHASMATTPGFWIFVEGMPSKFIDSIFTPAVFGSSLMPSGRRIPITKDAIVLPRQIADAPAELRNLYLRQSENNIEAYEILQGRGVPKEQASKIVQYGHRGGGFMFMPLETLIHFSKLAERDPEAMPEEGKEVISQLEDFVKGHGMGTIYEARKGAPRTGCVHPNIFRDVEGKKKNYAEEFLEEENSQGFSKLYSANVFRNPEIISTSIQESEEFEKRVGDWLETRKAMLQNSDLIKNNWSEGLGALEEIINDFNNIVRVKIASNIPWRVWGEVKRHRTLSQNTESIYHAVERALLSKDLFHPNSINYSGEELVNKWLPFISIPLEVQGDETNLNMWINNFANSLDVYDKLTENGIKKSEALAIIPRGIKLLNIKDYDLFNLTTGYMSLRLCGTAEPEMREITQKEAALVKNIPSIDILKELIAPKCHYVGFCPELGYQGDKCRKVNIVHPNYDESIHKALQAARIAGIEAKL